MDDGVGPKTIEDLADVDEYEDVGELEDLKLDPDHEAVEDVIDLDRLAELDEGVVDHPAPERIRESDDAVDWDRTDRCRYEWNPEWLSDQYKNQHCCARSSWPTSEANRCWWHMDGPKSLQDFLDEDERAEYWRYLRRDDDGEDTDADGSGDGDRNGDGPDTSGGTDGASGADASADGDDPRPIGAILSDHRVERELRGNRQHNATDLRGPVREFPRLTDREDEEDTDADGSGDGDRNGDGPDTGTDGDGPDTTGGADGASGADASADGDGPERDDSEDEEESEPPTVVDGTSGDEGPPTATGVDAVPSVAVDTADGVCVSDHPAELLCGVQVASVRMEDTFDFTNCWINGADLSRANLEGVAMQGVDLERVTARDAVFREATLSGADLRGDFDGAHMDGINLIDADVSEVGYEYAALPRPSLRAASLAGAELRRTDFGRADLTDADLSGTELQRADLERATLTRANLFDAELQNARLYGVVLTEAQTNDDTDLLATVDDRPGPLTRLVDLLSASRRYDMETASDDEDSEPADTVDDDLRLRLLDAVRPAATRLDAVVRLLALPLLVLRRLLPVGLGGETRYVSAYDPTNETVSPESADAPGRGSEDDDRDRPDEPGAAYVDQLTRAAGTYRKLERLADENSFGRIQRAMFLRRKTTERRKRLVADGAADLGHVGAFLSGLVYRYGEGYARVLGWCGVFVVAFGFLFPLGGWFRQAGGERMSYDQMGLAPELLWESVYYSTLTFTNLGFGDYRPAGGLGQLLTVVETAVGVVMLSLLVFVLGRRASR